MIFWDFEQIIPDIDAGYAFKLLLQRLKLTDKSAAQCLFSIPDARSYENLKSALTREFGTAVTRQDVYRMLRKRNWNKTCETPLRFGCAKYSC